jgi:hypothetical protein
MFGYTTVAGPAGVAPGAGQPTINGTPITWPAANAVTSDWFIVSAVGDVDGDKDYSTVVTSSWANTVWVDRDGE